MFIARKVSIRFSFHMRSTGGRFAPAICASKAKREKNDLEGEEKQLNIWTGKWGGTVRARTQDSRVSILRGGAKEAAQQVNRGGL